MIKRFLAFALFTAVLAPLAADSPRSSDVSAALRQSEKSHSEIMRSMHFLTDVYGPRLTGSPHAKAAGEWVVKTMAGWGFENSHLEPWEFGHPGWENERVTAHVIAPVKDQLTVEVLAWSPGTKGTVTAQAFQLNPPDRPTSTDLDAYLDSVRGDVKGKIVLAGRAVAVPPRLDPRPTRIDESRLRTLYDPNREPSQGRGRGQSPASVPPLPPSEINRRIDDFLLLNGAALRVNDAGRELGQIAAYNNPTYDISKIVPTVVMRNEDYGRIARILADGTPVTLEFNIVNVTYPDGHTAYNAIAELPGTDRKNQVVMLGGHLDSWHSATGATDNAIGSATMLEAIRILQAIGVKPRRTIRVALWSGEEQGLLGSQAYVKEHFGMVENPKPEHANFAGYFNIDSGTGRARGASVFGPPEAAAILREATKPFADNGFFGVNATQSRRRGGTDSTSFNEAGLPGIGIQQDPIEYNSHTWHTNLDTYERIIERDAQQSAMVIAAAVYHLAMREQMLPRLPKDKMPALPTNTQ